jgi:hypothetical protein
MVTFLKVNGKIIKSMVMEYYKENNSMKEIGIKIYHRVKALSNFKMHQNTKDSF